MVVHSPQCYLGLTNPQSPSNVGSVLRAAGCFDAQKIFYTGNRYDRARKYHTDTQAAGQSIPQIHTDDFLTIKPEGMPLICVDLVENAMPLPDFEHPLQAFYLFGPEDGSLSQAMIDAADAAVYVPTIGCLNLAATVNIVLYDRATKLNLVEPSNTLIRSSRDGNNATIKR